MATTEETKTFNEEEINNIIALKGANGKQIDIFNLHGVLYVGNCINGVWDVSGDGQFTRASEHSMAFGLDDFDGCESEEDILNRFSECLREFVLQQLV